MVVRGHGGSIVAAEPAASQTILWRCNEAFTGTGKSARSLPLLADQRCPSSSFTGIGTVLVSRHPIGLALARLSHPIL
jgi:hypothetical protein